MIRQLFKKVDYTALSALNVEVIGFVEALEHIIQNTLLYIQKSAFFG
jgi:hypothetical protein